MPSSVNNFFKKERKPLRLVGYDYRDAGFYYVTLCTHGRIFLFGEISNGIMLLSEPGKMVNSVLKNLAIHFENMHMDNFVIMPNHIHAIVVIAGTAQRPSPTSLSDIVKNFKTYTTRLYIKNVYENKWPSFEKKLWQRGFYEHIIRDDDSLLKIQKYIIENPLKWELDQENPNNLKNNSRNLSL